MKLSVVVAQLEALSDGDCDADTDAVDTRDGDGAPLAVAHVLPLSDGDVVVDAQREPETLPV